MQCNGHLRTKLPRRRKVKDNEPRGLALWCLRGSKSLPDYRYWCRFSSPIFETRDNISGLKIVCRSIRAE
jgi:hypothetical protein